jgi:hypothetical protein
MSIEGADLSSRSLDRIGADPEKAVAPSAFVDLGSRAAVDKTLDRLVQKNPEK